MTTERQRETQRIYGAGFRAGIRTALSFGGTMSDKQMQSIIAGLTGTAAKVYEVIPIAAAWSVQQIFAELDRSGANYEHAKIRGCLVSLVDQGLVKRSGDLYQRVQVRANQEPRARKEPPPAQPTEDSTVAVTPIDSILIIAADLRAKAKEMLEQADQLETACIGAMEREQRQQHERSQLDQLRKLLQSIGMGEKA